MIDSMIILSAIYDNCFLIFRICKIFVQFLTQVYN